MKDNSDDQVCIPNPQISHLLHLIPHLNPHPFFNLAQQIKAQNLHLKVHYPVDREHLQHRLALQMHHLRIHCHSRLYTHNINPKSLHPHSTHHQNPINNKFNKHLLKTNANQPTLPSILDEDQQCVPKCTNGSQVKHSKQKLRQQDECLCFHCNLPGHLKRSCPKIPYCSKCRTRGHTQNRCTNKSQRNRHTCQAGESRDQQKRNEDLPQFSSHHNKCLQCAGDHKTANCT